MKLSLSRQLIIIIFFRLLVNTGRRFVYPFAPALSRSMDVSLTAITSIIAAGQFTSFLGVLIGPLTDKIGYRFGLRFGLGLLAIGMLLCGLIPQYWPVFVGLVIASLGKTIFDPAIQSFIGSQVPFERRGRAIGIVETAWAGSTLIGIPALGLIIDQVGITTSFMVLGILGALSSLAIGWVIPAENNSQPEEVRKVKFLSGMLDLVRMRPTAGILIYGFWISVGSDALFVVYGAWFEQAFLVSLMTLGFSTIAIGGAELLGESLTALFADRIGLKRSIIIGLILAICTYLMLPFMGENLTLAMTGLFCVFLAFEFTMVSTISLSTELMPQARATMMAGFYATSGLGRMCGVLVGGLLWNLGGIELVSWGAAATTILGLLSLLWGLRGWHHVTKPTCNT